MRGPARFMGRMVTTAEELDTLPPETGLLDERTGAPWGMHTRFKTEGEQARHRETLIRQLPMKITWHPLDHIIEMRQYELDEHDAEIISRWEEAVHREFAAHAPTAGNAAQWHKDYIARLTNAMLTVRGDSDATGCRYCHCDVNDLDHCTCTHTRDAS